MKISSAIQRDAHENMAIQRDAHENMRFISVDVCCVIICTKQSRANQNIEMLLMPLFFSRLFRLLFSPAQDLDSDCP
jgi:hypothetical protein